MLLLCDSGNQEREVHRLEEAGVEALDLDVMDGCLVPNITYGMPIVAAVRRLTALPLDVQLMIANLVVGSAIFAAPDCGPVIRQLQSRATLP